MTHWTESEPVRLPKHRADRVYIAGPMTGLPEFNFPAFNAEAARLRSQGLTAINPAEHGVVDGADWGDYLRHDLAGLVSCERVHLLPGWSKSKGATLEVLNAAILGCKVTLADGAESVDLAEAVARIGGMLAKDRDMSTENPRWYVLRADGVAKLCVDELDAQETASVCDMLYPAQGPYRAVQLAPVTCDQPPTFADRNAKFREENWQIRFDAAVDARRAAQEQLYTERERHTAEVKRLQAEIGRLQSLRPQALPMTREQREQVFRDAENRMMREINLSWRDAVVECVEAHHGITAPAGGEVDRG